MAKKAKAVAATEVAEVVPESVRGLDISGLNNLIQQAQARIQILDSGTKQQRIAEFKKSDFFKAFKQKIAALRAEIKSELKESHTVEATIRFSAKVDEYGTVEDVIFRGGCEEELFEYNVTGGKVTGDGLTKQQKQSLESSVEDYVSEMCEDGVEIFFPSLLKTFKSFQQKVSELSNELETELGKINLSSTEINE